MTNHPNRSQYALPISRAAAAQWGSSRETDAAVAMAIHAISDTTRSPQTIWDDPTPTEWEHVAMAIAYYVTAGAFDATDDGKYQWGLETIAVRIRQDT
jgi:hypothetical protein